MDSTSQRTAAEGAKGGGGAAAPPSANLSALAALAPAGLAGGFGLWAGTAAGGATAAGAITGHFLLLAAAAAASSSWRDPLGLGRPGRTLPWALWLVAAAGAWASPVPRAGLVAVTLLPAFLLLPAAVGSAWRHERGRRLGSIGVAAVVAAVALRALAGHLAGGDPRAASPLGHHLLLAVWLLALLPIAALPAARERGLARWLGALAALAGAAALIATGSLAAWAGLALEAGLAALAAWRGTRAKRAPTAPGDPSRSAVEAGDTGSKRGRGSGARRRRALVTAALAAAILLPSALAVPRALRLAAGDDPSAAARRVYADAGVAGTFARPAVGWGPGSTPWTLAEHLRPVPGVNPPGEVVAELHSLPLQLAYELGISGLLLAAAIAVLFARRRSAAPATDPVLARAGLIGLAGAGVALLATAWLAVTALPVALAIAAGAALSGGTPTPRLDDPPRAPVPGGAGSASGVLRRGWPGLVYCAAAALVLLPLDVAHLAFDRAVAAAGDPQARRSALARAVRLDPAFPLYRAWLAWEGEGSEPPAAVAEAARRAAADARAVSPLWLAAGVHGAGAGAPWAAAALDRACRLDPLGALAPFHRAALDPESPGAAAAAARALLAAPGLAAATFWEGREPLLGAALDRVLAAEGVDPGWREELARQVAGWDPAVPGELAELALRVDPSGAESLLLRSFRRRPQSFRVAPVTLRRALAEQVAVPPATTLATTSPAVFAGPGCGLAAAPAGGSEGG